MSNSISNKILFYCWLNFFCPWSKKNCHLRKILITFEPLDGFSNFKNVKWSEFNFLHIEPRYCEASETHAYLRLHYSDPCPHPVKKITFQKIYNLCLKDFWHRNIPVFIFPDSCLKSSTSDLSAAFPAAPLCLSSREKTPFYFIEVQKCGLVE